MPCCFSSYSIESFEVDVDESIGEVVGISDEPVSGGFLNGLWRPFRAVTRGRRKIAECGGESVFAKERVIAPTLRLTHAPS